MVVALRRATKAKQETAFVEPFALLLDALTRKSTTDLLRVTPSNANPSIRVSVHAPLEMGSTPLASGLKIT